MFQQRAIPLPSPSVVQDEAERENDATLGWLVETVWRRGAIFASVFLICLGAALVYLVFAPTLYTSIATMVIDTKRTPLFQGDNLSETQVDDAAVQSQVETIKSENVAIAVIKKLNLTADPEFSGVNRLISRLLRDFLNKDDDLVRSDQLALRRSVAVFANNLRVIRLSKSYVVNIAFSSTDRNKAAQIANATAEAYIEDQFQAKFDATKRASAWLQQRIGELRSQATDAFKSVQDFKSDNNLIIGQDGKLATDRELGELTDSLAKARAQTTQAQARLQQITAVLASRQTNSANFPDASVTDALSSTVITKLRDQYLQDQKLAEEYTIKYGPKHQTVLNLQQEMLGLQRGTWSELERIAETYKSDYNIARSNERTIEQRLTDVFQKAAASRQLQVKLQELETSANTYKKIYEEFLNRYTQAVQQQSFPSTEARVITLASQGEKTSPQIILVLALATFLGAVLGIVAALVREKFDRVVYTRDQVSRLLNIECIAAIPSVAQKKPREKFGLKSMARSVFGAKLLGQIMRQKRGEKDNKALPRVLFDPTNPFTPLAEALRNVKVAIDTRRISHTTCTIGIISALPNEGKSTIAASLAALIGAAGRSTLLMDCDMRNPSLSELIKSEHENGVIEVLYGDVKFSEAVIRQEDLKFDFLSGPRTVRPTNGADILSSEAMAWLLGQTKKFYHYVIVDLPPLLPVVDARASAHLFDAFILVTRWGETNVDDLKRALALSPTVKERMIGVILNQVDREEMRQFEGYTTADSRYLYSETEKS